MENQPPTDNGAAIPEVSSSADGSTFTTGEVLSAGTGILCCEMGGVYRILNFLTGESLFTHQLPRAMRACESWVKHQCPWINEVDASQCSPETVVGWLAAIEAKVGKTHILKPLPAGGYEARHPLEELGDMIGKDRAAVRTVVVTPDRSNTQLTERTRASVK